MDAVRETLLDLITAINADRRSLAAEALHTSDPARKKQCERVSRAQATVVSRITRAVARNGKRHASLSDHEFEGYVDSLVDAYIDGIVDPFTASGAISKAPTRRRNRDG